MSKMLFIYTFLLVVCICSYTNGFRLPSTSSASRQWRHFLDRSANAKDVPQSEVVKKFEKQAVERGLTHIKQNKFAPSPEEAKNMSDEEFRMEIYKRMKVDERERRKKGPVGGAVADEYEEYLNSNRRKD